ncbi:hypothetical protein EDB19DRAFT_1697723, partial [Suillus lakei]
MFFFSFLLSFTLFPWQFLIFFVICSLHLHLFSLFLLLLLLLSLLHLLLLWLLLSPFLLLPLVFLKIQVF